MLNISVNEAGHSKCVKRPHNNDPEKDVSPPKIITPRTRSKVAEENTPRNAPVPRTRGKVMKENTPRNAPVPRTRGKVTEEKTPRNAPVPAERLSRYKGEGPVARTPIHTGTSKTPRDKDSATVSLTVSETRRKRSRSNTLETSNSQAPRSRRSRSNTSSSEVRTSRSNIPVVHRVSPSNTRELTSLAVPSATRKPVKHTPIALKCTPKERKAGKTPVRTPSSTSKNPPKSYETPKIPRSSRTSRAQIFELATPEQSKSTLHLNLSDTPESDGGVGNKIDSEVSAYQTECSQDDAKAQVQTEIKGSTTHSKGKEDTSGIENKERQNISVSAPCEGKGTELYERPSSVSDLEDMSSKMPSKGGEPSPTDSSAPECTEELQKEMERVKKRRSTLGRGRRSGQSFGGRSLCPVLPILSLEDQISNIDKELPQTSKISHLLDISIREAMRRLEGRCRAEECLPDLRLELITNSEKIGGHAAYKIAGMPLEVNSCVTKKTMPKLAYSLDKAAALKTKTKELEQEYRCWKTLLKERKLACQAAEREFREARSGETEIDDDNVKNLTSVQRSILAAKPNYNQYIKEVQMAREKTFLAKQEINHTASVISNFLVASKAVADSCYDALEKMTFGNMKLQPLKSALSTLLTSEEDCSV